MRGLSICQYSLLLSSDDAGVMWEAGHAFVEPKSEVEALIGQPVIDHPVRVGQRVELHLTTTVYDAPVCPLVPPWGRAPLTQCRRTAVSSARPRGAVLLWPLRSMPGCHQKWAWRYRDPSGRVGLAKSRAVLSPKKGIVTNSVRHIKNCWRGRDTRGASREVRRQETHPERICSHWDP